MRADAALLRLHIEAVWEVSLPALTSHEVELPPESLLPSWQLYAATLAEGSSFVWRADVPQKQRVALRQQAKSILASDPSEPYAPGVHRETALALPPTFSDNPTPVFSTARRLLNEDNPLIETFRGHTLNAALLRNMQPLVGVVINKQLLCLAHSARRTSRVCELGIETRHDARRKGYAIAATRLWTQLVRAEGLLPFYSADANNTPSLRLAAAAGYQIFASGVTITL